MSNSNNEDSGTGCGNIFRCFEEPKKRKRNENNYGEHKTVRLDKLVFNSDLQGKIKYIRDDGTGFQGIFEEGNLRDYRKIKKQPNNNSEEYMLKNLQPGDILNVYIGKVNFFNKTNKKNLQYVDVRDRKNYKPQKDTKKHLKVIYGAHGLSNGYLDEKVGQFCFPNADNRRSYYLSSYACYGAFVRPHVNNSLTLLDVVKNKISKNQNCIGFFSKLKKDFQTCVIATIDKNGIEGQRRVPVNTNFPTVNNEVFNKDKYFDYYCIVNEPHEGNITQKIYKIPQQLCYWRETLIDDKKTRDGKYPNKFMEALDDLKSGKSYKFTTKAFVDEGGDKMVLKQIEITIKGTVAQTNPEMEYELAYKENMADYEAKEMEEDMPEISLQKYTNDKYKRI